MEAPKPDELKAAIDSAWCIAITVPEMAGLLEGAEAEDHYVQPEIVKKVHTKNAQNANGQMGHSRFVFVWLIDHPIDADHDAILTPVH